MSAAADSTSEKDTRTPDQVEADLVRLRAELSETVNELVDQVNPVTKINEAKEQVGAALQHASDSAKSAVSGLGASAQSFAEKVKKGDPTALGILGAGAAAVAAGVAVVIRRSR